MSIATENHESPVLTVAEAAALLKVERKLVYTQIEEGIIPSLKIGRRILVPTARFLAWVNGEAA